MDTVKGGVSERFRIESGVRQGCVMPPLLAFQCMYGCRYGRNENGDGKEGREWRLPTLLYAEYLVLSGESEEDLIAMMGRLVEVGRMGGL